MRRMAETMEAHAREIERLRMELQRTNIKQKDNTPKLTSGSLEEFIQEERVTQWMRMCVGALKDFLDQVGGGALQWPTDHAGGGNNGDAPLEIMCLLTGFGRCCASPTLPTWPGILPVLGRSQKEGRRMDPWMRHEGP